MRSTNPPRTSDLNSIPGEFRENYLFLCELISCEEKNATAKKALADLVEEDIEHLRGKLTRRQLQLMNRFIKGLKSRDPECLDPPVPAELEASLRIRTRSTWLPWELEAIQKIDRWRKDVSSIKCRLEGALDLESARKSLRAAGCSPKRRSNRS